MRRPAEHPADPVAAADREVELSRQRLEDTRKQVVEPLRDYAQRNNFTEAIRLSLVHGHPDKGP